MVVENLLLSALMVALTAATHFAGLAVLSEFICRPLSRNHWGRTFFGQGAVVLIVVFGLFTLHMIEILLYAVLFLWLGLFGSFEPALYFSTSTFTTVGFGDITLDENWRLLAGIESANGFLLIGWSTAFLVSLLTTIDEIERDEQAETETIGD